MPLVEHTVYSPDTVMVIADIDPQEGEDIISFMGYQYPIQGRWEEGEVADSFVLIYQVFSSNLVPGATPVPSRTLFLRDLGHPKYRLRSALPVVLEVDGPHVVAYSHDLDMFGWGDVEDEALLDFKGSVCELYENLREDPAALGPHLQRVLRHLEEMIVEEP
jgi:hypothetical protein